MIDVLVGDAGLGKGLGASDAESGGRGEIRHLASRPSRRSAGIRLGLGAGPRREPEAGRARRRGRGRRASGDRPRESGSARTGHWSARRNRARSAARLAASPRSEANRPWSRPANVVAPGAIPRCLAISARRNSDIRQFVGARRSCRRRRASRTREARRSRRGR